MITLKNVSKWYGHFQVLTDCSFICQLGSAAVSSCGNGRTACAALDDTDGDMTEIYGEHLLSVRDNRLCGAGQTQSGCLAAQSAQGVWGA